MKVVAAVLALAVILVVFCPADGVFPWNCDNTWHYCGAIEVLDCCDSMRWMYDNDHKCLCDTLEVYNIHQSEALRGFTACNITVNGKFPCARGPSAPPNGSPVAPSSPAPSSKSSPPSLSSPPEGPSSVPSSAQGSQSFPVTPSGIAPSSESSSPSLTSSPKGSSSDPSSRQGVVDGTTGDATRNAFLCSSAGLIGLYLFCWLLLG